MVLKLNISDKGTAWKLEVEPEVLAGKNIGETVKGEDISADLTGYEIEITGGSDFAGFPMKGDVEGVSLKRVLLTKGWGMQKRSRGDKKKVPQPKGLRLRKTVRGKVINEKTVQVNLKVLKQGTKKLAEIFPDQNKKEEPVAEEKTEGAEEKKVEAEQKEFPKTEEKKEEPVKEEVKEEKKEEKAESKTEEKSAEKA